MLVQPSISNSSHPLSEFRHFRNGDGGRRLRSAVASSKDAQYYTSHLFHPSPPSQSASSSFLSTFCCSPVIIFLVVLVSGIVYPIMLFHLALNRLQFLTPSHYSFFLCFVLFFLCTASWVGRKPLCNASIIKKTTCR